MNIRCCPMTLFLPKQIIRMHNYFCCHYLIKWVWFTHIKLILQCDPWSRTLHVSSTPNELCSNRCLSLSHCLSLSLSHPLFHSYSFSHSLFLTLLSLLFSWLHLIFLGNGEQGLCCYAVSARGLNLPLFIILLCSIPGSINFPSHSLQEHKKWVPLWRK